MIPATEVVAGVVAVLVALAVGYWIGRRAQEQPGTGAALLSAASTGSTSGSGADPLAALQTLALDDLPMGVLVLAADGEEAYRNRTATDFLAPRVSGPLVRAEIVRIVEKAAGASDPMVESSLELYGPPKRVVHVSAHRGDGRDTDGTSKGTVVVVTDVTEEHRINTVRRDFVANVSHELKTPVAALGLLAEALAEEDDPSTARRLAGRLQGESLRLANTIDDLLALSEVETDQGAFGVVNAVEIRAGVEERSAETADQRKIAITWHFEPADLSFVGDRRQIVSAVGNLVDNALNYSEGGSTVEVGFRVATDRDRPMVEIVVSDEGIGIPEADRERIFERFYRVDPARSRSTGGTGLGLSIVRHVMLNHGGTVDVESTEGVGTTFVMRFPQTAEEAFG